MKGTGESISIDGFELMKRLGGRKTDRRKKNAQSKKKKKQLDKEEEYDK